MGVGCLRERGRCWVAKVQDARRGVKPHWVTLCPIGDGRKRAERLAAKLALDLEDGRYKLPTEGATFADFLEQYRTHYLAAAGPDYRPQRERTWILDGETLRRTLEWLTAHGKKLLTDITTGTAERYRDERMTEGRAVATVRKETRIAKAAWNWAIRAELAATNPWVGLRFPKAPPVPPRNLSQFELRRVMQEAQMYPGAWLMPALGLALYAGLRLGELCALEWTDIRWDEREITVSHDATRGRLLKGQRSRVTLLPDELRAILAPIAAPAGYVVGPDRYGSVQKALRAVAKRAGVSFSVHDLRRTFAGALSDAGVPVTRVRDYLGHASLTTTEGYYLGRSKRPNATDADHLSFGPAPVASAVASPPPAATSAS